MIDLTLAQADQATAQAQQGQARTALAVARSDLRRAERHLPAAPNLFLAEMMELGRWGDERHRQVRGLADRSPGVAHGGGDITALTHLAAPTRARGAN